MMKLSRDEAIARRRAQNRLAQRRFRWKQSQQNQEQAADDLEQQLEKQNEESHNNNNNNNNHDVHTANLNALSGQVQQHEVESIPTSMEPESRGFFGLFDTPRVEAPIIHGYIESPVTRCRFNLFGNTALLRNSFGAGPGDIDDMSAAVSTSDFDVTAALLTPQASQDHLAIERRQSLDMTSTSSGPRYRSNSRDAEIMHTMSSHMTANTNGMDPSSPGQLLDMTFEQPKGAGPITPDDSVMSGSSRASASGSGTGSGENSWLGPLHMAAQKGHDRIVRVLLQHDSDRMDCNERDSDGLTPLYYAITGGYEGIVALLVEHGARIDEVDSKQRNALHWAVLEQREGLLKLLLDHCGGNQALINCYDDAGMTPLHTAIDTGFEAGVRLLLQYGGNPLFKARKK
ncbi:ankyrin repeat-containing domain protein [Bombardia bombarda]|uniref:Ankyrin repeat-containing domain protein n=1 Tax=Bombardia bombarda TaxID=252184 RepID=A0AA40C583_9PEZI|nr:ankyrin repeat-containing domain protein [Bombardia bombarda]